MALVLDSNLQAQLDTNEREPIANVISTSLEAAIPFNGNDFGIDDNNYLEPDVKFLSGGELALVTTRTDSTRRFRFMITDWGRNQWTEYTINLTGTEQANDSTIRQVSLCEKPDENIAVLFMWRSSDRDYVRVKTITKAGEKVGTTSNAVVTSGEDDVFYEPYIIYNTNESEYQVVYGWYDYSAGSYHLMLTTSSDLSSWSGPTDISPGSLGTTKKYNRPHIYELSDNDIVIAFDHVSDTDPASGFEMTNCYYIISQDGGSTWSSPTQVTSYTSMGSAGRHPCVMEKSTGNIYFTFHERFGLALFDYTTTNVQSDCSNDLCAQDIHMYNGRPYLSGAYTGMGTKKFCGFWIIEPSDMSMWAQYTTNTSPDYNDVYVNDDSFWYRYWGAGQYLVRGIDRGDGIICVVSNDGVSESVTDYAFSGDGGYGIDKNLSVVHDPIYGDYDIHGAAIDAQRNRMYCYFYDGYLGSRWGCLGWVDLTETPDPVTGYYTFNEIWQKGGNSVSSIYGLGDGTCLGSTYFRYCKEDDVVLILKTRSAAGGGMVMVVDAQTGVIQLCKNFTADQAFPYNGLSYGYVYDNRIYGSFSYTDLHDQESWRGLWIYDMVTQSSQVHRPGYATVNQYWFYDFDFADIANDYVWMASNHGAVRYHIGTQAFEKWGEAEIPGWRQGNDGDFCHHIAYDTATGDVYTTQDSTYLVDWTGVRRFNVSGDYYKGKYAVGTKSGTSLGLGDINDLTLGNYEKDITPAVDSDDILWAIWDHVDYNESDRDLYWDHDTSEFDVTDDLTDVLEIAWDIEAATELHLSLANGFKYDQQNSFSTQSYLFRKGRKVEVKLGETVDGTPYLHDQGHFIVTETQIRYSKDGHPILTVTAHDYTVFWREHRVVLTDHYEALSPKEILDDLLDDWTIMTEAEYSIPVLEHSHEIWHQWGDETLYDIIKQILDHFEYVFHFDVDGVFVPRQLDFERSVDHVYGDQTQIKEYSPDLSFSSFINKIRVVGQTHDTIQVVYDPEMITNINGTVGWWNEEVEHTVWYNEERTRTCRNPYLIANMSTADFSYFGLKGGGKEEITFVDPEELYCVVTIEGPNLIPVVVGLAATILAIGLSALGCVACGPYIYALAVATNLLCYALLAEATYNIDIYAQPTGEESQTIQYEVTDVDQLNLMGQQEVIEEIEDPLCYTVHECQRVAEFEMNVIKYQRERIRLTKLAHLQDEILDMIEVNHPYSDQTLKVMIASLRRTLTIKGTMMDQVEGWRML